MKKNLLIGVVLNCFCLQNLQGVWWLGGTFLTFSSGDSPIVEARSKKKIDDHINLLLKDINDADMKSESAQENLKFLQECLRVLIEQKKKV